MRAKLIMTSLVIALALSTPTQALESEQETRPISGYRIVRFAYEWNGTFGRVLQIWKGRKKLSEHRAHDVWIYSMDKQAESFSLTAQDPVQVIDLTGDGVKDLIVQEWSGGAHGAYTFDIYSLGPKLKHIWHHYSGNGHLFVVHPRGTLPQLLVENDADYLATGAPLDDMPIDIYRWDGDHFRPIRKHVARATVLPKPNSR